MPDSSSPYAKPNNLPSRRVSRTPASATTPKRRERRRRSWIEQLLSSRRGTREQAKPDTTRESGAARTGRRQTQAPVFASSSTAFTPDPNVRGTDLRRSDSLRSDSQRLGSRRTTRARRSGRKRPSAWPPQADTQRLPQLPSAPRPVLWIARTLIIGVGVAALTGTLLSVLTPADTRPGTPTSGPTAAQTESAITADGSEAANTLGLTQELAPLKTALVEIPELTPGLTPGLFWVDLDTGAYVNLDGQESVPAASTVKLPILVALFEEVDAGRISLEQIMQVQPEQIAGGSGDMQNQSPDLQYTVLEVATQMIINSDNTATNMIIDLLGGNEALNGRFADWGLTSTQLNNPLPDLEGTNTTSPRDLVKMMALLHRGEALTLRSRDRIFNILQRTYNKRLLASGVEEGAVVYNKTGDIGVLLGDVALVDLPNGKRYAVAALVTRPENDGRARELIRRLSQTIYQAMASEITPTQSSTETDSAVDGVSPTSDSLSDTDPSETEANDVSP